MSETHRPTIPGSRAGAATTLGVPADTTPAGARAAFLRRLVSDGFTPPEAAVAATNAIAATALPLTPEASADETARLRTDVAAFAAEYWSLGPAERRARWGELSARCRDERTRRWLAALESGLGVHPAPHLSPLVEETAAAIRLLFVLGPRERAVRRAVWLAERAGQLRDFGDAVRRFRADAPELAGLEPELVRRLSEQAAVTAVPAIDSRIAEEERAERARQAAADVQRRLADQGRRRSHAWDSGDAANAQTIVRGGGIFVALVVLALVRSATTPGTHSENPYRNHPTPTQDFPVSPVHGTQDPAKGIKIVFSATEIQQFEEYERQRASGAANLVAPRWYSLWQSLGRPGAAGATGADLAAPPWSPSPPAGTAPTRR